jgi:hypothetical protein
MLVKTLFAILSLTSMALAQTDKPVEATPEHSHSPDKASTAERAPSKQADPAMALQAARQLLDRCACSLCKGEGAVTKKVHAGNEAGPLPGMTQPVYVLERFRCEKCDGVGLAQPDVVQRLAIAFLKRLCALAPDDPRAQKAVELSTDALRECAEKLLKPPAPHIHPRVPDEYEGSLIRQRLDSENAERQQDAVLAAFERWQSRFNDPAVSSLTRGKAKPDEPVVIVGRLIAIESGEGTMPLLKIRVNERVMVELFESRIADALPDDLVLAGGLLHSSEINAAGVRAVLRSGVVIKSVP